MRLINNNDGIFQADTVVLHGMILKQVVIGHEDDMGWVLEGFGVEVGTELLALAVKDYLVQVFYLGGLFHV